MPLPPPSLSPESMCSLERRRLASGSRVDGWRHAALCCRGGRENLFNLGVEGRVAAEVEWRVSNAVLYSVRRQRPRRARRRLPWKKKKKMLLCVACSRWPPVCPLLIFMKWKVCSARGRVRVCVFTYTCALFDGCTSSSRTHRLSFSLALCVYFSSIVSCCELSLCGKPN